MQIPQIEPFQFIRSTAFSERVQLANKINEIIDGINSIGEIPDIQAEIDVVKDTISQIQTELDDTNSDVSGLTSQVNTLISEVNGLLKEVISKVTLDSPGYGQVRVKVIHEDETETASNVLQIPVIQDGGITLISGTTDRSFKIQYVTTDGVTHTTNDFVIPEGGGTDVTVTSVSIEQGDTANSFKFEIGLSDGSSIQSNSYPFPPGTELTPATTSQLGGIKVGTNLKVTEDGTLSVDMTTIGTAAAAASLMWTADASKVTFHADSLAGSEFTKDIPQAAQGGAGTIDQASYAKIAANESAISEVEATVNALAPSVSVNAEADPPTITIGINGKTAQANLPSGGKAYSNEITINNDFKARFEEIPEMSQFCFVNDDLIFYGIKKSITISPSIGNCNSIYPVNGFKTSTGGNNFIFGGLGFNTVNNNLEMFYYINNNDNRTILGLIGSIDDSTGTLFY